MKAGHTVRYIVLTNPIYVVNYFYSKRNIYHYAVPEGFPYSNVRNSNTHLTAFWRISARLYPNPKGPSQPRTLRPGTLRLVVARFSLAGLISINFAFTSNSICLQVRLNPLRLTHSTCHSIPILTAMFLAGPHLVLTFVLLCFALSMLCSQMWLSLPCCMNPNCHPVLFLLSPMYFSDPHSKSDLNCHLGTLVLYPRSRLSEPRARCLL